MTRRISIALILLSALFVSCAQRTAQRLQEEIGRGHALYEERRYSEAMEAYSQAETMVLLIISRKYQMNEVVNEIKKIDKKAFVSVSTAMSVYGEGFEEVKTGLKVKKPVWNKQQGIANE